MARPPPVAASGENRPFTRLHSFGTPKKIELRSQFRLCPDPLCVSSDIPWITNCCATTDEHENFLYAKYIAGNERCSSSLQRLLGR
jgi:hypothetical protein